MDNFIYNVPTKVFFGRAQQAEVGQIIKGYGYKKVLLHYGKNSIKKSGLYDEICGALRAAGIDFIELGGVEANPKVELVAAGAALCRREGVELILAVGGGSVVDSAKVMAICALEDNAPFDYPARRATAARALPVGVILTLAASGSEMSASAVLTDLASGQKRGFNSDCNRPLFSILNPELTFSVDLFQTGCGIVDIMMHTLERYFVPTPNCELTDSIALALVKQVVAAGQVVMRNPADYEARATLMWAGSLSHNDLTGCGKNCVLVCHQLEHIISGDYDHVAHGAGLSVAFPAWCKYVYRHDAVRFARFAQIVFDVSDGTPEEMAREGIVRCEAFFKEIGMPVRMGELGIDTTADFADMAFRCANNGTRTLPGILTLDVPEITEIFELMV